MDIILRIFIIQRKKYKEIKNEKKNSTASKYKNKSNT